MPAVTGKDATASRSGFAAIMTLLAGAAFIVICVSIVVQTVEQRDARVAAVNRAVQVRANDSLTDIMELKDERPGGGGDHLGVKPYVDARGEILVTFPNATGSSNATTKKKKVKPAKIPSGGAGKNASNVESAVKAAVAEHFEAQEKKTDENEPKATPDDEDQAPPAEDPQPPKEEEEPVSETTPQTSEEQPIAEEARNEAPPDDASRKNATRRLSEAREWCEAAARAHAVRPGRSWGSLARADRDAWLELRCDRFFCRPDANAGRGRYDCVHV